MGKIMWIKQGRIFHLEPVNYRTTHCQVPTPYVMKDRIRLYYSCRSANNISFIASFDLSLDLKTVLYDLCHPIMAIGEPGMFDSDGTMPSCVIENQGELWMYYIGWNARTTKARYQNEIGLAVSTDEGITFKRKFEGPIMGRTLTEPGLAVMPYVMYKNWFRMWYQSGTGWKKIGDKYEPLYVIKSAKSVDGIQWDRNPAQCVETDFPIEAHSRPSVFFDDKIGVYNMWYCHRDSVDYRGGKGSYRISHAYSQDGIKFIKTGKALELGDEGEWDSEMQCYPSVIKIGEKLVMFYNGNGFGQTGIGLAIWEGDA